MRRSRNYRRSLIALFIAVTMLAGCGRNMQASADNKDADSTEKSQSEEEWDDWEESEEDFEDFEDWEDWEDYEEDESEEEEPSEYIEYVEWDGTETIKKSVGAKRLSDRQYFNGKTYVIDLMGGSLGADLPLIPRQEGDRLVEPEVIQFLLTEDKLLYLEDNHRVFTAPWYGYCCDLYVQFLDTGEVRRLATDVEQAVYDDGVIIYRGFIDYNLEPEEQKIGVIGRVEVETGKVLDDLDFGDDVSICGYTKDCLYYVETGKKYCYNFETQTKQEMKKMAYSQACCCEGNIYSTTGQGIANGYRYVLLYEQGKEVNRIFPKVFSSETYFSCGKVFWLEERKIMEYILETGEEKCVCELGENEYGLCNFLSVEESNGMILVEEIGMGPPEGYGISYLYEVKDGVKTLVTDDFWTT